MFYCPEKYNFLRPTENPNVRLRKLEGVLEDAQARLTLCEFLRTNIGVTFELLTGFKLFPDQLINLKGSLTRNFTMWIHGRGLGKSFSAGALTLLQGLLYPNSQILIAGPTFRHTRNVWNYIEKFCNRKESQLIAQAMGHKSKLNDGYSWEINDGMFMAIPLSGDRIRGFRSNFLIVDEFLLMTEDMVERVLIPFLIAPQDLKERQQITEKEDELVLKGIMKEEERTEFANKSKMVAMSSASYTCEYAYKKYCEYIAQIQDEKMPTNKATFFVSQMAWNSIPEFRIDKSIIELAQSNEANSAIFAREYGARFVDGSDSYFSMNKMLKCSMQEGEQPTLLLRGDKNKKYILSIDPNESNTPTADNFAMCVLEIDEVKKEGILVHGYAKAGRDLKDKIKYLFYILTNFNIVMIAIDHAGYEFIQACNESQWFKSSKIDLKFFDFKSEADGEDYINELKKAKLQYNITTQKICFWQIFNTDYIRKSNEWLQGCIDWKKIWFSSSIKANNSSFNSAIGTNLDPDFIDDLTNADLIDTQDALVRQTRYELASIECKVTGRGTISFELPNIMKRDRSASRMRRDSAVSLVMANWCLKQYFEITALPAKEETSTFEPFWG